MEKIDYTPLLPEDDEVSQSNTESLRLSTKQVRLSSRLIVLNVILFVISITLLSGTVVLSSRSLRHNTSLRESTFFSPVVDELDIEWTPRQYQTTRLTSNDSIYRRQPSAEVDMAWSRITDIGVHILSSSDVSELGKDPSKTVRAPESWGYGPDAHLAHLDGLHLLHCLNSMRKSLHFNFDYYHPHGVPPVYQSHLSHCLDTLVQHLMCQPSVEMITYNWVEKQVHPFPDFDINHQCWDFEALLDWQNERRVKDIKPKWDELVMPEDWPAGPIPLLMLEAYNVTESDE